MKSGLKFARSGSDESDGTRTMMRRAIFILMLLLGSIVRIEAQPTNASAMPENPIQDNSFLAEEAYNQEPGVVQHIQTFMRMWNSKTWTYSFTQE